jgi:hypothetical protein
LDEYRIIAEQRKRVAKRIKELQPEASNRAIAKVVGVSHETINNDLSGKKLPVPAGGHQEQPIKIKWLAIICQ